MRTALKTNKDLFFRLGLGSFFLVNSIGGWTRSDEIQDALHGNAVTRAIGHTDALCTLIGVNDALLFLLILSGRYKKAVLVWAAVWMGIVILVTGVWTPDFITHLGVLAFLVYYACLPTSIRPAKS